jgi:hypothetical protein
VGSNGRWVAIHFESEAQNLCPPSMSPQHWSFLSERYWG